MRLQASETHSFLIFCTRLISLLFQKDIHGRLLLYACFCRPFQLELALRYPNNEATELLGHFDLTGKTPAGSRIIAYFHGRVFHIGRSARLLSPAFVHVDAACTTGTIPPAFSDDAGNPIPRRGLHDGRAGLDVDDMRGPVRLDKSDLNHLRPTLSRPALG
jgi:hypothetical protein